MPKLYVAICGEIGAGKGTVIHLLKQKLEEENISVVSSRFSDIPRAHLAHWEIPETREAMQYVTTTMRKHFGRDILPALFKDYLKRKEADIVLIDGPRWKEDEEFIRGLPNNVLIYITASRSVRLARINARKENAGEGSSTSRDLLRQERRAVERHIPVMGSSADITIVNEGSREALETETKNLVYFLKNKLVAKP